MKVIAVNGSPRKNWNTATLLQQALEGSSSQDSASQGSASQGVTTELIHLYDYHYQGCISCFSCKLKNGKSYGRCAVKDELTPLLRQIETTDVLILGSPIYIGAATGMMRSFLERLTFPYLVYDGKYTSLFPGKSVTGFIYTLGAPEERVRQAGYDQQPKITEMILQRLFGAAETLLVTDTYQFDDYSQYETSGFDEAAKARRRKEVFPADCRRAYEMGVRLTQSAKGASGRATDPL